MKHTKNPSPHKKLSKKLIIFIAIYAVVIACAVIILTFLVLKKTEYNDIYTKSQNVAVSWNDFISKHSDVSRLVDTDSTDFSSSLDKEKTAYGKFTNDYQIFINSPLIKDSDIKAKYDASKIQANLTINKINIYFEIINPIHEFVVKSKQLPESDIWSDAEVDNLVAPLISSKNDLLVKFGQEFSNAAKKLFASINTYEISGKYADYSLYLSEKSNFSTNFSDLSELDNRFGAVNNDDINKLSDLWSKLNNAIYLQRSKTINLYV